ncbi:hypothetical protein GCM10017673_19560 [Streptosporangium violaceochromogenes]|nr:hypothetical protein GCM10017673_19560 [Streptosporangium violaceochromogenes]
MTWAFRARRCLDVPMLRGDTKGVGRMAEFDEEVDVVVVGSGAGALTGALT